MTIDCYNHIMFDDMIHIQMPLMGVSMDRQNVSVLSLSVSAVVVTGG
jgi:hypothetical protein